MSCDRLTEANRYLGVRCRGNDIPCLGLAVRKADGPGEAVIRMNLNGELFVGEQQFKQQGWVRSSCAGPLKPEFANRFALGIDRAPGNERLASPRFANNLSSGVFDRYGTLLFPEVLIS
jgi:hypothetical protein